MSAVLAIATRNSPGSSRLARVPGASKKNGVPMNRNVAHVGLFKCVEINRLGFKRILWREVENFAEFDGPHAHASAVMFAEMKAKNATPAASMGRCVADGPPPPPPPLWRNVEDAQIQLLEAPAEAKEPETKETEAPPADTPTPKTKKPKKSATR